MQEVLPEQGHPAADLSKDSLLPEYKNKTQTVQISGKHLV